MYFANPTKRANEPVPPSIGHDYNNRCTLSINSDGQAARCPDAQFQPPILVHIESGMRDVASYPNPATFRVNFPVELEHVYSIEVLSVNYPNPTVPPVTDRYLWLLNGLFMGGNFKAQANTQDGGIFVAAVTSNNAPSSGATGGKANAALAKLDFDLTQPAQLWKRNDYRQIKFYKPALGKLKCLELTLAFPDGTPITLPQDTEWSVVLEIVAKQG